MKNKSPRTDAERQKLSRANRKRMGLARVELWILPRYIPRIKAIKAESERELKNLLTEKS